MPDWPPSRLHPEHEEVFPLDFEPVLNHDGTTKNDCERTAAKRLCTALHERYPALSILLVEDALYANAPHLRQIQSYGWSARAERQTGLASEFGQAVCRTPCERTSQRPAPDGR